MSADEMVLDVSAMMLRHLGSDVRVTLDRVPASGGARQHWRISAHVDRGETFTTTVDDDVDLAKQTAQRLLPLAVEVDKARQAAVEAEARLRNVVMGGTS